MLNRKCHTVNRCGSQEDHGASFYQFSWNLRFRMVEISKTFRQKVIGSSNLMQIFEVPISPNVSNVQNSNHCKSESSQIGSLTSSKTTGHHRGWLVLGFPRRSPAAWASHILGSAASDVGLMRPNNSLWF